MKNIWLRTERVTKPTMPATREDRRGVRGRLIPPLGPIAPQGGHAPNTSRPGQRNGLRPLRRCDRYKRSSFDNSIAARHEELRGAGTVTLARLERRTP